MREWDDSMKYEEAMKYIHEVGNFGSNYGLERTFKLLEILGNPQEKIKFIHVAGTNGKGSTTAMITEILKEQGYKVGMYTSPFLEEFEERIQINGINIAKNRLSELVEKVKIAVDRVIEEGFNHPTEFEIITCLMFLYFYEEEVDYAVIEVGLGGKLDSTNVITPVISVITSISYDHTNLLGNTLREIAGEKAGIIKKDVPVVMYPQETEALEAIEKKAKETNSKIYKVDTSKAKLTEIVKGNRIYQKVNVEICDVNFDVNLPLLGEHQINNLLLALNTYKVLCEIDNVEFKINVIERAIENVKWIGRLEVMKRNPLIVIDGAHNIQGITKLRVNIEKYFDYNNLYLLLGILADKQVEDMVSEIVPMAKKIYALTPHNNRAENNEELKKVIKKYNENCVAISSYEEALKLAIEDAKENDLILASGSLYMIGDIRKIIRKM